MADNYNFNIDPDYAVQLMNLWKFGVSNEQCQLCLDNSTQEYVEAGIIASSVDIENLKRIAWKPYDLSSVEAEFK